MWGAAPYRRRRFAVLAFAFIAIATPTLGSAGAASGAADTTPPSTPTNLAPTNSTTSSITVSWTAATDNVGVAGYGVYLDRPGSYKSAPPVASTSTTTATISGLSCGSSYKIAIDAYDAAGNRSSKAAITAATSSCPVATKDTTPPSTPTNLSKTGATPTSITVSWTGSTDNVAVAGYDVFLNKSHASKQGALVAASTTTSATISGLTCGSSYDVSVDAYDAAGNHSTAAVISTSTSGCGDTTPPTVPTNLGVSGSTATTITVTWSPSTDNVGVSGYDAYLNGAKSGQTTGSSYAFANLSCGTSYTLAIDAYDAAGNRSGTATVIASTGGCADATPPSVPDNQAETGATQTTITMSWSPSTDNVAVAGYNVFLNGTKVGSTTLTTYTYTGLSCGTTYTVGLQSFDAAGNVSNLAYATGLMSTTACGTSGDTQPPSTPTGLAASAATASGITVTWNASSDNVSVVGYDLYLNGSSVGKTSSTSYTFVGLACGTSYTLGVDAYDAAGNLSKEAILSTSTGACSSSSSSSALYVSPSGSDSNPCSQTAPCKSFQRAYSVAQPGQLVSVAGGSYGNQPVTGTKSAPKVVFQPAPGASVSISDSTITASNLEFDNLNISYLETDYQSDGFTCRNCSLGNFGVYGSANTSIVGGQSGPSYNPGGSTPPIYITYGNNGTIAPTNLLLDGVYIHDYRRGTTADHMECMMVVGGNGITIRNSRFVRCDIFDIYFTEWAGPAPPKNITLENNFFDETTNDGQYCGCTSYAVRFGDYMTEFTNIMVDYNSAKEPITIGDNPKTNVSFIGNLMPWGGCTANVTYLYNVMQNSTSNACGATNTAVIGPQYGYSNLGFVDPGSVNLDLSSVSPAINKGDPLSYPGRDIEGNARPAGPAPDAGANEAG